MSEMSPGSLVKQRASDSSGHKSCVASLADPARITAPSTAALRWHFPASRLQASRLFITSTARAESSGLGNRWSSPLGYSRYPPAPLQGHILPAERNQVLPRLLNDSVPFRLHSVYGVVLTARRSVYFTCTGDNLIQHGASINCVPNISTGYRLSVGVGNGTSAIVHVAL
jgi:hypothetical protein